MLDFRLTTFLSLCETRNYTQTAKLLNITQPAVSQHIRYLEKEYQVQLFEYEGRKLSLTKKGKKLRDSVILLKQDIDRTIEKLKREEDYHVYSFGATLTIGEYMMPSILRRYFADYPENRIHMQVDNTEELMKKVELGELDFAIVEGHLLKENYRYELFHKGNFIAVCGKMHPLAQGEHELKELFMEHVLVREVGSGTRTVLETVLYERNAGLNSFRHITEIGSLGAIKDIVKSGVGITFVYEEAVQKQLKSGSLCKIDVKDFDIQREFNMVWLKNSHREKEIMDFYLYIER